MTRSKASLLALAASFTLFCGVPSVALAKDKEKDKDKAGKDSKQSDPKKLLDSLKEAARGKMDAKHKEAVKKLEADLKAVKEGAKATADQKKQVHDSLVASITGAHKPSEDSVKKLAATLSGHFADGKLSAKDVLAVEEDVVAVLYATKVSGGDVAALRADVTAIAEASSGAKADAKTIAGDVEAVAKSAEEHKKKKDKTEKSAG